MNDLEIKEIKGWEDISVRTYIEFTDYLASIDNLQNLYDVSLVDDSEYVQDIEWLIAIIYDIDPESINDLPYKQLISMWDTMKKLIIERDKISTDVKPYLEHPTYDKLYFVPKTHAHVSWQMIRHLNHLSKIAIENKSLSILPKFAAILWQPEQNEFSLKYLDELEKHFMEVPITDIYSSFFLYNLIGMQHINVSQDVSLLDLMMSLTKTTMKMEKKMKKKKMSEDQISKMIKTELSKNLIMRGVMNTGSIT